MNYSNTQPITWSCRDNFENSGILFEDILHLKNEWIIVFHVLLEIECSILRRNEIHSLHYTVSLQIKFSELILQITVFQNYIIWHIRKWEKQLQFKRKLSFFFTHLSTGIRGPPCSPWNWTILQEPAWSFMVQCGWLCSFRSITDRNLRSSMVNFGSLNYNLWIINYDQFSLIRA